MRGFWLLICIFCSSSRFLSRPTPSRSENQNDHSPTFVMTRSCLRIFSRTHHLIYSNGSNCHRMLFYPISSLRRTQRPPVMLVLEAATLLVLLRSISVVTTCPTRSLTSTAPPPPPPPPPLPPARTSLPRRRLPASPPCRPPLLGSGGRPQCRGPSGSRPGTLYGHSRQIVCQPAQGGHPDDLDDNAVNKERSEGHDVTCSSSDASLCTPRPTLPPDTTRPHLPAPPRCFPSPHAKGGATKDMSFLVHKYEHMYVYVHKYMHEIEEGQVEL